MPNAKLYLVRYLIRIFDDVFYVRAPIPDEIEA